MHGCSWQLGARLLAAARCAALPRWRRTSAAALSGLAGPAAPRLQPLGLQPLGLRPLGLRPLGLWPLGLRPLGLRPLGLRPPELWPPALWPPGLWPPGLWPAGVLERIAVTPGTLGR